MKERENISWEDQIKHYCDLGKDKPENINDIYFQDLNNIKKMKLQNRF